MFSHVQHHNALDHVTSGPRHGVPSNPSFTTTVKQIMYMYYTLPRYAQIYRVILMFHLEFYMQPENVCPEKCDY